MKHIEKSYSWKVTFLAVVSIIIVIAGYAFLSNFTFSKKGYKIRAVFNNVSGLFEGADVQVHGVTRGRVSKITIHDKEVEIEMLLDKDVHLNADARAGIYQTSLISNVKYINITPGTLVVAFDTTKLMPTDPVMIFDIGQLSKAVEDVEMLVSDIKSNFDTSAGELLKQSTVLVVDAQSTVQNLTYLLAELRQTAVQTRSSLAAVSSQLSDKGEKLDKTIGLLDTTLCKMDTALTLLIQIERSIARGEGTLGKLIKEDSLYYDMRRAVGAYEMLAEDIRANPRKYINLEVF
ncbi:MCE family protein [candidate division WOR-3 bacterium]|nr:MCE family protein [candidate division WOR-3 bacterium]